MARQIVFLTVLTFLIVYKVSHRSKYNNRNGLTFRAAVYEYQRFSNSSINQSDVKRTNLGSYGRAIRLASHYGADIIVFPESGLFSANDRPNASLTYEYIPSTSEPITPCFDWDHLSNVAASSFSIYSLSCLASSYKIYIVAVLGEKVKCSSSSDSNCPNDGFYFYNTQVMFDSSGKLIAKYHKYHLFFESAHNIPTQAEIVTVSTPFGKLGFLICFDILFEHPVLDLVYEQSVDTLIFGAHWIDELPFLNGHVVQSGFSIEHNVNLLAAGINDLNHGALGSGIYAAGKGPVIYTADISRGASRVLIADVPKTKKGLNESDDRHNEFTFLEIIDEKESSDYVPWTLALDLFNHTKLSHQSGHLISCDERVCCELDYSKSSSIFNTDYYLIAKRWIRPTTKICEQFCGLIAYDSSGYAYTSKVSFTHLKLTGTFDGNLIIPSVVTDHLRLVPKSRWAYFHESNVATISFNELGQTLLRATLYSRCEKDDEQIQTEFN